jgi:uncharacterized protein YggE
MMRRVVLAALVLTSGRLVFGQSDPNSITVTATRTIYSQPDQVVFQVSVSSGLGATLDSVVAALAGSGITASDLSSVAGSGLSVQIGVPGVNLAPPLQWTFTLPVPLSKLKDTIASLTTLQQAIAQKNTGLSMTFSVQGTLASPQQCSTLDLIADARTQAQKLANAAGVSAGPIIGVSEPSSAVIQTNNVPLTRGVVVFDPIGAGLASFLLGAVSVSTLAPTPPLNCSLVVTFAMLR